MASNSRHSGHKSVGFSASKTPKRDHSCVAPPSPQMSLSDVRKLLKEELAKSLDSTTKSIESLGQRLGTDFETLQESIDCVKSELTTLSESLDDRIADLVQENNELRLNCSQAEVKINKLTDRIVSLEGHMRRDNLKFLNIKVNDTQGEDCESLILALCKDMGITLDSRAIIRAHRTGPKRENTQPIIVKFGHFKDKMLVLKEKNRFREIGVLVVEDFPPEVLERRKAFYPALKAAYESNGRYKARLVVDKLLLNGKMYTVENMSRLPAELQSQDTSTVTRNDITAFFTNRSPLSNHHPSQFVINDQEYSTVEQYFMYQKALFFSDQSTAAQILETTDPKEAKSLARRIQNFDRSAWREVCKDFMKKGLQAKFDQNEHLATFLKDTGATKLVEANPHDKYWGVGLSLRNTAIWDSTKWEGSNNLGSLLEDIRNNIKTN